MLVEIKVPMLAESVPDATLLAWQKKVGETVEAGASLIDLETDKVTLEVTAPSAGAPSPPPPPPVSGSPSASTAREPTRISRSTRPSPAAGSARWIGGSPPSSSTAPCAGGAGSIFCSSSILPSNSA